MLDGELIEKKKRKLPKFVDGNLVWLDKDNINGNKNINNNNNSHSNIEHNTNFNNNSNQNIPTKAQKIELLKRDLIGIRNKSKFREGIKWL